MVRRRSVGEFLVLPTPLLQPDVTTLPTSDTQTSQEVQMTLSRLYGSTTLSSGKLTCIKVERRSLTVYRSPSEFPTVENDICFLYAEPSSCQVLS